MSQAAKNRVVIITGASSGIGHATALQCVARGDNVIGTARRADKLDVLARAAEGHDGTFVPVVADVRSEESMQAVVAEAMAHFGRVDVLVANAGIGHRGSLIDAGWDDLEALLRTNIDGVLHSVRAVVPAMRAGGGGQIVIISSVVYNLVAPYTAIYAASKAFVSSLAQSLRLELEADGVHVVDVLVGRVETEFNAKRLGKGGRTASSFPSAMPVERAAEAVVRATYTRRRSLAIRWIDRLIMLGNRIVPDFIGRKARKQYR